MLTYKIDGMNPPSDISRLIPISALMKNPKNHLTTNVQLLSMSEFEAEFHRLPGQLVRAHSQFDHNVGLKLWWLGRWYGMDVAKLLGPRMVPCSKRLKKLRSMVLDITIRREGIG